MDSRKKISAIVRKHSGTCYRINEETGKEEKYEAIANADIAWLVGEVERLLQEVAELRGKRNGKVAGRNEGSGF